MSTIDINADADSFPLLNINSSYKASFAQERMWFLQESAPESPFYNLPVLLRFDGPLDLIALENALVALECRHETLRTTFRWGADSLHAYVQNPIKLHLALEDLSTVDESEQEVRFLRLAREEAKFSFNLTNGPIWRQRLYRFDSRKHILLLTFHHICMDEWSIGILQRELSSLFNGYVRSANTPLAPLSCSYSEYSSWQRGRFDNGELDGQLEYWRKQLKDAPSVLELPLDFPRQSEAKFIGANEEVLLSKSLLDELSSQGREMGVTLFMSVLGAFQVLLYRYTGQEDILVCTPVADRSRAEFDDLAGLFLNTLVLRLDLSGQPTVKELFKRVGDMAMSAYSNLDVPFEKVVQDLREVRDDASFQPFQVMLSFHDAGIKDNNWDSLTVIPDSLDLGISKNDLTLSAAAADGGLHLQIEYDMELFKPETIQRMLVHLGQLLEGIVANPEALISELPLLTSEEREQLLVEWNDTALDYPKSKCIHELFEQQVSQRANSVAVVFEDQELTYGELNERANQLAHYLVKRGVKPDTLVGLCLNRSLELVVGMLGILKAGGAYLPLDLTYPLKRLEFMLADAEVDILVTEKSLLDGLPVTDCQTVCLDEDASRLAAMDSSNLPVEGGSDSLAYTMYTSGSTGQPKGVQIPHSAVVNFLTTMAIEPGLSSRDRLAAITTPAFDISVLEIFLPLTVGACVEVVSSDLLADPPGLADRLSQTGTTVMQATPATWQMLIDGGWKEAKNLKVLCGGEALSDALAGELRQRCGELWNVYGPTETTVWSTISCVGDEEVRGVIGHPIGNTQVYVLDREQELVPIGVAGELYIGGDGLARGYRNRPALTDEKFVENPFSEDSGSRLYRTGDLARWRPDGTLEFLGRMDDQVKLRGFRIELGEIESVLNDYGDIAQSVVVLREDRPGEKFLAAYCIPKGGAELDVNGLKSYLRERLPDYMVPAAYVTLDAFPLTPNGKVSRRSLPAPVDLGSGLGSGYIAPRTPIEEQLAFIWGEVLGIEEVGIRSNFFEIGGHSLLAVRVNVRVASVLQVELPLRSLYEAPTIEEFASEIERVRSSGASYTLDALKRVDREDAGSLPLSFGQQRLWFLEQIEGELTAYNIPLAWRIRGPLDVEALRAALEMIVRRHEPLRTTVTMREQEPVQVIGEVDRFALPVVELDLADAEERESEIDRLGREEAVRRFDLSKDLLLRAKLLKVSRDEYVLFLTLHHIASDGWSFGILKQELGAFYDLYSRGEVPNLPPLAIQYADYASWQRKALQGDRLEKQLSYWREQLSGLSNLELPTDRPRPPVQSYRGDLCRFELSEELIARLKKLGQTDGATLQMTLFTAFNILLGRYSGQDDVAVGIPTAGRNHALLEDQIGMFINTLVLRTDLSAEPTFRELLKRVRETSLEAYDHQDLPFEKLVEELDPERDLGRSPFVQVTFQLMNLAGQELVLDGLDVIGIPWKGERVHFDIDVYLWSKSGGITGAVNYSTDLFDHATIERMVSGYLTLLEGIVANPEALISELPLLTSEEREQLLVEWNDTALDYPKSKCIHELFEQQVTRKPDAIAATEGDRQITYGELNLQANQLAHYLLKQGIHSESKVGVCFERSIEMIVSLLAILKVGGAYVPLDPDYPEERLELMIEDAAIELLVTRSQWSYKFSESMRIVELNTEEKTIFAESSKGPNVPVSMKNLAYVMYTSGSTGTPKGVCVEHQAVHRLVRDANYIQITPEDVIAHVSNVSFDAATFELWGALANGAGVAIINKDIALSLSALVKCIETENITVLFLTTALFNYIAEENPDAFNNLNSLLFGGEAVNVQCAGKVLGHPKRLLHVYGPTECTTFATWFEVKHMSGEELTVPIGRPITNTTAFVLDKYLNPVPIGVPGELHLGGLGLARGYLNRPKLTAESFVENPFCEERKSKLYKTGDWVRYLPDGNIEFLGRQDNQVKVRGHRIEPGEIKVMLEQHPCVRECMVEARFDQRRQLQLVAYVVFSISKSSSDNDFSAQKDELRNWIKSKLPKFMIPTAYVWLTKFPLTKNGKIDRQKLPDPWSQSAKSPLDSESDLSPLENNVRRIWQEVLEVEQIGLNDDFFELGGHSILSAKLVYRIENELGYEVPLATIFSAPTIAEFSKLLVSEEVTKKEFANFKPNASVKLEPLFFFHFLDSVRQLARFMKSDRQMYGIHTPFKGAMETWKQERVCDISMQTLATRSVKILQGIQPNGPYYLAGYCFGGVLAFEVARQLIEKGESVAFLGLLDATYRPGLKPFALPPSIIRLKYHSGRIIREGPGYLAAKIQEIMRRKKKDNGVVSPLDRAHREELFLDQILSSYSSEDYPGPAVLFRTTAVARSFSWDLGEYFGWDYVIKGGIDVEDFDCKHAGIFADPYIIRVAETLDDYIGESDLEC